MHIRLSRSDVLIVCLLLLLVASAIVVRLPGVYWLVGYGFVPDYSFHPDDYRFVVSAKDFPNPEAKPNGYPLFMPTQLYLVDLVLRKLHINLNLAVILRWISMAYAILGIVFCYAFLRFLTLSKPVALLSSFFLAYAPLHIILSHFGTADISAFLLFYVTIFAAWQYQRDRKEGWFYLAAIFSGLTMADKFFIPSLVPVAIIILTDVEKLWRNTFVAACIFTTFYSVASFFNFTPWDLARLLHMLAFDNLVVDGGKSPLQQIVLYPWDIIACSGVITAFFALIGACAVGWDFVFQRLREREPRKLSLPGLFAESWRLLKSPSAVIVLPLLFHFILIVTAQVHFSRHILIFIPIVCVLAAVGFLIVYRKLTSTIVPVRVVGLLALAATLLFQVGNGYITDRIYLGDVREKLGQYLAERPPSSAISTFSGYSRLKNVSLTDDNPNSPVFVTCDLEYQRYVLAGQGKAVFHLFGGKVRTEFFNSLFAGQTDYSLVFSTRRDKFGLEDHLAARGWLPPIDTYVPNECRAFQKRSS